MSDPPSSTEGAGAPVRIIQITDPHVGAAWAAVDPLDTLRAVVTAVRGLPFRPAGVLVTGDLAADGTDAQYAALVPVLAELELPTLVLPGNHDDREAMRRHFHVGEAQEREGLPLSHIVWFPPLRVVMLDTTVPGEDGGDLDELQLAWLESVLSADGRHEHPTLIAMHHPPFDSGVPAMDRIALAGPARGSLAAILGRHPQVCGVIAGHHHRTIVATFAGRPAVVVPGTYCQLPLDFTAEHLRVVTGEPVAFAVHTVLGGMLVSHVQTLDLTAARA